MNINRTSENSKSSVVTTDLKKMNFSPKRLITSLHIYHFSTVVDFSSEKYSGSTDHRRSWYQ